MMPEFSLFDTVFRMRMLVLSCFAVCLVLLLVEVPKFRGGQPMNTNAGKDSTVQLKQDPIGPHDRNGKTHFKFFNRIRTEYDKPAAEAMKRLVDRKASSRDPELVALVRDMLDPPPTYGIITLTKGFLDTPQSKEVEVLLPEKRNGFFVDCGGMDGEASSNSLPLEKKKQWTGIIIEANPFFYTQLLGKNRNVWSLNACLSPFNYAAQLHLEFRKSGLGNVRMDGTRPTEDTAFVPCFPFETIMLAMNRTQVDYFSLDVEGLELEVLKTIPFERVDINVFSVEYRHGASGKAEYKRFMESKGYRVHKDVYYLEERAGLFAEDYIFVKDKK